MAWPWNKKGLKVPKPHHPKLKAQASVIISGEYKKIQDEQEHIKTKLGDIKVLAKKHAELSNFLGTHKKNLSVLERRFDDYRKEIMDEMHAVNKNLGPLYDKSVRLEKGIKELELADKNLLSEISKIEHKVRDTKEIVQHVESVFNTEALKKLKAQLIEATNSAKLIESNDLRLLKKIQNVDRRIGVIEKHSAEMSTEKDAIKKSAEALAQHAAELKETVGGYSDQLVELSGKVSANIAKTADVDEEVHAVIKRLQAAEAHLAISPEFSKLMQEHSKMLAEIARRLEYLEKTTVKTVVLD